MKKLISLLLAMLIGCGSVLAEENDPADALEAEVAAQGWAGCWVEWTPEHISQYEDILGL